MKKIAIAMISVVAFAGSVCAADVMEFPAKMGTVTFNHKAHQEKVKGVCTTCHATAAGGKIEGFGKDFAHKTCKGCHEKSGGPTKCGECHKKKQ
ncbi:MAG TPA: cytochrome c3 family protein [Geobacteraceae bacterium]